MRGRIDEQLIAAHETRGRTAVHVDIQTDQRLTNTAVAEDLDVGRRDGDATDAVISRQRGGGASGRDERDAGGCESFVGRQSIRNFDEQRLTESALDRRFAELECERGDRRGEQKPNRSRENLGPLRPKHSTETLH